MYEVSDKFAAEILTQGATAIGYWCEVVIKSETADDFYSKLEIIETADEDGRHHTVDLTVVRTGIERMMKILPEDQKDVPSKGLVANFWQLRQWLEMSIQDDDTVMVDSDVADCIIQLGLYNELVYG